MSLKVAYYPAGPELSPLVNQFEILRLEEGAKITDKHIPRGDSALVFHFRQEARLHEPESFSPGKYFIAPILTKAITLEIQGPVLSFIVACKTPQLSRLCGLDLREHKHNPFLPLTLPGVEALAESLASQKEDKEMIRVFESYIAQIQQKPFEVFPVDLVYNNILIHSPFRSLKEILAESEWPERRLRRHFEKYVGISPKTLARIVRVNHLFKRILQQEGQDFLDLIFECRYCDQPHFIKDFKSIVGETPHALFQRRIENVRMMSGHP
jgi:AraC-like DNA-binding protein